LVQDNVKRAGFLLLLPHYKNGAPANTLQERQSAIQGWVYAPFIANSFLGGINTKDLTFTVYDDDDSSQDNIIYSNADSNNDPQFTNTTHFEFAGRSWIIQWNNTAEFLSEQGSMLPSAIMASGIFITLLLSGLFFLLARTNGHAARSLVNSQNQLQAVFDGAVDGLLIYNADGIIKQCNSSCVDLFGYASHDIVGRHIYDLIPKGNFTIGSDATIGRVYESIALNHNKEIFPIEISVSEVSINDDILHSTIIRDITDRKTAEMEILRSNEELEHFAYIASHDLQEPMRMVANFTYLLEDEYADKFDLEAKEYMHFITDGAKRMQSMINDLLEYSRVDSGDAGIVEFDVEKQFEIIRQNLEEPIEQTQANITINGLPETLYFNPIRFTRVMQNIIGNAIKYRDDNRTPNIKISAKERKHEWLISIEDNGIGIKPEYLDQIFVIFKRLHGRNEYSGTGIGLSVCKRIIEGAGGKLWVESTHGKGSTFYITIKKILA